MSYISVFISKSLKKTEINSVQIYFSQVKNT